VSKFKTQTPIIHIPSFTEYKISASELSIEYKSLGITIPFPISDNWYYFTDSDGWAKILPDIILKSDLYKADKFDCEDYAMKAMLLCAERYGLNTLRYTYGDTPMGRHGFNTFWVGDIFQVFEPNTLGLSGIKDYKPISVLL